MNRIYETEKILLYWFGNVLLCRKASGHRKGLYFFKTSPEMHAQFYCHILPHTFIL